MTEKQMRPIVEAWLEEQGWDVAHEIMLGGYCDLVGFRFGERQGRRMPPLLRAIAVELKITDVGGVFDQAQSNQRFVHESFAAMPDSRIERMRPETIRKFKLWGIGLLAVNADVKIIHPAISKLWYEILQRKLWRIKRCGQERRAKK